MLALVIHPLLPTAKKAPGVVSTIFRGRGMWSDCPFAQKEQMTGRKMQRDIAKKSGSSEWKSLLKIRLFNHILTILLVRFRRTGN